MVEVCHVLRKQITGATDVHGRNLIDVAPYRTLLRTPVCRTSLIVMTLLAAFLALLDYSSRSSSVFAQSAPALAATPETTVALPRVRLDNLLSQARSSTAKRTINVSNGEGLHAALEDAALGDDIVLQPGVTYVGPFTLKKKSGKGWITIRSAAATESLPPPGTRIRPLHAEHLPKIVSETASEPAIKTKPGAFNYRIFAVEISAVPKATAGGALVALGDGSRNQNSFAMQPYNLVLDRVYIHGTPDLNFRRCIALNSGATVIVDSWISECHGRGFDSQAIAGWNGTGPYKIVNNYLEGAGENVMFGGADPSIPDALPSDIEFRRNHVYKPVHWKSVWTVKNHFELKLGRRILIEGNVFENNWVDGQVGFSVVFKSTNESNTAPWSQTADVTFQYNIVRNSTHGISMAARPEANPALPASRIRIAHNVLEGLSATARVVQTSGIQGLSIENNVGFGGVNGLILYEAPHAGFVAINNIFGSSSHFVASADGKGIGTECLNNHAGPDWTFRRNLVIGAQSAAYPKDNFYPAKVAAVGFRDFPDDLRLKPNSRYIDSGVDGQPLGPDFAVLEEVTGNVVLEP